LELEQKLQGKSSANGSLENKFKDEKYASVLCYPKYDPDEAAKRVNQLNRLGVKAIHFIGDKRAFDIPILGRGHVGIVVVAITKTGRTALKIRRLDADRKEMQHEAEMLAKANSVGIGPRLIATERDFLLMEFIDGTLLPDWTTTLKGRGARKRIRVVLRDILEQCYQLDHARLDHGELSRAPKHVIIDKVDKPHIVDFETASTTRRTSNVTSISQYLFIKSQLAGILRGKLGELDHELLVAALRDYKHEPTRRNFEALLKASKLID
jgi:putative serine/threonine protein kinase